MLLKMLKDCLFYFWKTKRSFSNNVVLDFLKNGTEKRFYGHLKMPNIFFNFWQFINRNQTNQLPVQKMLYRIMSWHTMSCWRNFPIICFYGQYVYIREKKEGRAQVSIELESLRSQFQCVIPLQLTSCAWTCFFLNFSTNFNIFQFNT